METIDDEADLLYGAPAIASFMKLGVRQVHHLKDSGLLPTFPMGGRTCARKTTIRRWLADQEAKAINTCP